jgi:hypothetical protein
MPDALVDIDIQAGVGFFTAEVRTLGACDLDLGAGLTLEVDAVVVEVSHAASRTEAALWVPISWVPKLWVPLKFSLRKFLWVPFAWVPMFPFGEIIHTKPLCAIALLLLTQIFANVYFGLQSTDSISNTSPCSYRPKETLAQLILPINA